MTKNKVVASRFLICMTLAKRKKIRKNFFKGDNFRKKKIYAFLKVNIGKQRYVCQCCWSLVAFAFASRMNGVMIMGVSTKPQGVKEAATRAERPTMNEQTASSRAATEMK